MYTYYKIEMWKNVSRYEMLSVCVCVREPQQNTDDRIGCEKH